MDENIIDVSDEFAISFLTPAEEGIKYQEEIQDLEKILNSYVNIVKGFLNKLASNPDATTIKWPDRIADINKLKKQLDKIYKGK